MGRGRRSCRDRDKVAGKLVKPFGKVRQYEGVKNVGETILVDIQIVGNILFGERAYWEESTGARDGEWCRWSRSGGSEKRGTEWICG